MSLQIYISQIHTTPQDLDKNFQDIIQECKKAISLKANLIVFPELTFWGYPAYDLVEKKYLIAQQNKLFKKFCSQIPKGLGAFVGLIEEVKDSNFHYNAGAFVEKGKKPKYFFKSVLATSGVFEEARFFKSCTKIKPIVKFKGVKILPLICEEIWSFSQDNVHGFNCKKFIPKKKYDLVLSLNASPYYKGVDNERIEVSRQAVKVLKAPLVYVNRLGASDEHIFDGGSFVINKKGDKAFEAGSFDNKEIILNEEILFSAKPTVQKKSAARNDNLRKALILGLKSHFEKTGLKTAVLGLSGGVDSAVVLCLLAEAIGGQKVQPLFLKGPFSSALSEELSLKMVQKLKMKWITKDISSLCNSFGKVFGEFKNPITFQNLQSRMRMLFLASYANEHSGYLVNTSNKSELAMGYGTLYGDLAGVVSPLGDVLKTQVYDLARYYEAQGLIPKEVIERPPSAELAENQTDEQSLMPYNKLDPLITELLIKNKKPQGSDRDWVWSKIQNSEFKRWQSAPILKVSARAFGKTRRYPS